MQTKVIDSTKMSLSTILMPINNNNHNIMVNDKGLLTNRSLLSSSELNQSLRSTEEEDGRLVMSSP